MAKIYPERLPVSIKEDPKRRAECVVFAALKVLPNPYVVFYSVHWQTVAGRRGMEEGEADFVIAHPDKGVVVLEVKGGGVRYSPERGQWYSRDSYGTEHEIKDPVAQGSHNFHQLLDQLKALPEWPGRYINLSNAVCFPDIYVKKGQVLRPDLPRELILDHDDVADIVPSVEHMFNTLFGDRSSYGVPGVDGMKVIEGYLARSFDLKTSLGVEMEAEEERLIHLTEEQFRILSFLGDRKRAAIAGCAGSGKTMLAVRKAQQFAKLGMSVLLTCFNAPLADDLKKRLPNVDVYHFHGLCKEAADRYGFVLRSASEADYYEDMLPQALLNASAEIGRVYDAVIVDEGQDFKLAYWTAIEPLLKENGYLYIFYDNNQNLYAGSNNFGGLIDEAPFPLNRNCRNTQKIHEVVAQFHNSPQNLWAEGPQGREPELVSYRGEDEMLRQLPKILHHMVNEEHVACEDIVILTSRGEERTRLKPGNRLGMFTLTAFPSNRPNTIQATSVYKFKGLERRLVILTEIDTRTTYNPHMVMYVGCSRARTHLVILHDVDAPAGLMDRLGKKK